ncbi:ferric reductase-like transmembrane domain-containing protein [Aneurinibacillus sp. REN35]|uniref:ferric reductase-like transmembrane domain-containing protein n=1 Tax=Aneurinibacillus sp. REN35 TaxID=3237286 RepID=UPI003529BA07
MWSVFEFLSPMLSTWHMIRASGLVAYGLVSIAVISGMLQSLRMAPSAIRADLVTLHNTASWFGLLFAGVHGWLLLYDQYVGYTVVEIAIPFISDHETIKEAIGILSFYLFFILVLSSDIRSKIGQKAWRVVHYTAFLAYVLSLVHSIAMGTDTAIPWVLGIYLSTACIIFCLLVMRITRGIAR